MVAKFSLYAGVALITLNVLAVTPVFAADPDNQAKEHQAQPKEHQAQPKVKATLVQSAKPKVASATQKAAAPKAQVAQVHKSSGKVDSTANGRGIYSTRVVHRGDKTFVDTTDKFADGKTVKDDTTYIHQKNGSYIKDSTMDNNGKVSKLDEDFRKTGQGDYAVSGKDYTANGQVDSVKGTDDRTKSGMDANMDYTNAKGQNKDVNTDFLHAGNARSAVSTGTGFNGQAINNASLSVANAPSKQVTDSTVNGHGTWSNTPVGDASGQNANVGQRNFNNGASTTGVTQAVNNGNGTSTVQNNYSNVNAQGGQNSGTSTETYTGNGNGGSAIAGTYSQSNGNSGTVNGALNKTNYGHDKDLTYTNQNGQTQTVNTQALSVGGATLDVNSGTNYNGQAIDNSGLSTTGK